MLVAGTVALDLIVRLPRMPEPNEPLAAQAMDERFGGCGGNTARALARLGTPPVLLSAVGGDFAGSAYEAALQRDGVNLSSLVVDPDRGTARAVMAGDASGDQLILYHEGATPAMDRIEPVAAPLGHFGPGAFDVYPGLMATVDRTTFDPGQEMFHRPIEHTARCLEQTDILLCNQHEARYLVDRLRPLPALLETLEAIVITDEGGQWVHTTQGRERVEGVEADVVDATGAGDGHRAGVLWGLARGASLSQACRVGSVVAAFVLETLGPQTGLPTLEQVRARFEAGYDESFPSS